MSETITGINAANGVWRGPQHLLPEGYKLISDEEFESLSEKIHEANEQAMVATERLIEVEAAADYEAILADTGSATLAARVTGFTPTKIVRR